MHVYEGRFIISFAYSWRHWSTVQIIWLNRSKNHFLCQSSGVDHFLQNSLYSYSGLKVIEAGIFFTENSRLLFGDYMVVIQTLFTNLSPLWPLCHICWMVCSLTVTYDWFPVIWSKSWRVSHMGQEMLTLSGTPDFTPFWEFLISPINNIYNIFVSFRTITPAIQRI